jgi:hypothetical protein
MIPSIYPGDLLTIRSENKNAACRGDIVLHVRDGRFCVHRVTHRWEAAGRLMFATWGDAAARQDPPFDEKQLLGRVTAIVRRGVPVELPERNTVRTKLLRWAVRESETVATALLRLHLLQARILGDHHSATSDHPRETLQECS